jgi:hypothetical protein
MQNAARNESAPEPAPSISADFLTGSTETGLDRIRTRLLDLTNRNKLLNFRHSNASSLRVVDVPIDHIFTRLRENDKLSFLPVPEPDIQIGEPPSAKEYAEELGWNASFDLDVSADGEGQSLPVLHYQESLDTVSRKIASAAKTAIEESGTNMLYLVFGFLEWYESDDSKQPHLAPLVVVPVTIERTGGKGRAVEAVIEYSGEDIETNLSLVEKMRRDFGLEIPPLEDDDTPEAYFGRFDELLKIKKSWSIRRHVTLALLSFGKLLMFRDLDPKTWPEGHSIANHPLVRELFEGKKNPEITLAEEYPIDAPERAARSRRMNSYRAFISFSTTRLRAACLAAMPNCRRSPASRRSCSVNSSPPPTAKPSGSTASELPRSLISARFLMATRAARCAPGRKWR